MSTTSDARVTCKLIGAGYTGESRFLTYGNSYTNAEIYGNLETILGDDNVWIRHIVISGASLARNDEQFSVDTPHGKIHTMACVQAILERVDGTAADEAGDEGATAARKIADILDNVERSLARYCGELTAVRANPGFAYAAVSRARDVVRGARAEMHE